MVHYTDSSPHSSRITQISPPPPPSHDAIATRGETVCHRRTTRKYKSWRTGEPSHRLSRAINENKTSTAKVEPLFATRPSPSLFTAQTFYHEALRRGGEGRARNEKRVRFYVLARASQFFYVSNDFHENAASRTWRGARGWRDANSLIPLDRMDVQGFAISLDRVRIFEISIDVYAISHGISTIFVYIYIFFFFSKGFTKWKLKRVNRYNW